MIRKTLLVVLWFPLTFVLILINLTLLVKTTEATRPVVADSGFISPTPFGHTTATAESAKVLGASVVAADSRAFLLSEFLNQYKSPMAPYADLIVRSADENGLDFRLLVSIAMCESNLGKHMPSKNSFNPFGIAVYTGTKTGKAFDSWQHAITWVSSYIKERYYDRGITDLRDIGAIWAPPSVNTGDSWYHCVSDFQKSIL